MRKFPFPNHLLNTPCTVVLNTEGLNEDGEPEAELTWSGNGIFFEKSKTVTAADNRIIRLEAHIILKGDIAPSVGVISDGSVSVNGRTYSVYRAERARNPDGSVHHTTLELM